MKQVPLKVHQEVTDGDEEEAEAEGDNAVDLAQRFQTGEDVEQWISEVTCQLLAVGNDAAKKATKQGSSARCFGNSACTQKAEKPQVSRILICLPQTKNSR